METLPQGYLAKKGGRWRQVRLADVLVLIYHLTKGAADEQVGFEDAQRTLEQLMARLNFKVRLPPGEIESALWSCNLLNEQGKWWHPTGKTFDEYLKDLLGNDAYDKTFCLIERKQ